MDVDQKFYSKLTEIFSSIKIYILNIDIMYYIFLFIFSAHTLYIYPEVGIFSIPVIFFITAFSILFLLFVRLGFHFLRMTGDNGNRMDVVLSPFELREDWGWHSYREKDQYVRRYGVLYWPIYEVLNGPYAGCKVEGITPVSSDYELNTQLPGYLKVSTMEAFPRSDRTRAIFFGTLCIALGSYGFVFLTAVILG